MPMTLSPPLPLEEYERAAREYQSHLTLDHYMESTGQSTQRSITMASFEQISRRRPEVRCFSELLLQYLLEGTLRQVVPDNMVFVEPLPDRFRSSYNLEVEQIQPFLVLEYVSESNRRKDYVENLRKYGSELRIPCYVLFRPERLDLQIYRLEDGQYVRQEPGAHGRVAIPELDLELALYENWLRFWFEGELVAIPREFSEELDRARELADQRKQIIDEQDQLIRRMVERAATRAGRRDILERLTTAQSLTQLKAWLAELDAFL